MGNTESYNAEQDNPVPIHMPVLIPMPVQTPMPMQMPMQMPMSPPYPLDPVMYPQTFPAGAGFIAPYLPPDETVLGEQEDSNLPAVEKDASNPNQEGEFHAPGFEDNTIRKAFIRKVFTLLTIQILITFTAVCVCCYSDTVKKMIKEHDWVRKSSYIVFAAVDAFLATFYKYICIFPLNLLGLLMVTLSLSYMVGTSASHLDLTEVVIALGSTLVISFSIVIFSAQYLLVDCELVIGRKRYKLNPEHYVLAALIIYLDIFLILMSLLEKEPKKFEGVEKCAIEMSALELIGDADSDSN
ncbi:putative protein lifeguard 1 [Triplophysa rosa]|uniref:Uncharacterized protein n=1 Tax=Triplophysa rosa TaxID=992332 RepID=A0A9W7WA04_TRIRA|nr:putative protein lifeguard 1 [Triplophysa rosa]